MIVSVLTRWPITNRSGTIDEIFECWIEYRKLPLKFTAIAP